MEGGGGGGFEGEHVEGPEGGQVVGLREGCGWWFEGGQGKGLEVGGTGYLKIA